MFLSKRGTGTSTPFLQRLTLKTLQYASTYKKMKHRVGHIAWIMCIILV